MTLKEHFRGMRKYYNLFVVVFIFGMMATFSFLATRGMKDSSAASLAGFNPGNIINDATMGNYNTMSINDIQNFLTSKNRCSNTDYGMYQRLKAAYPNLDWHWANGHFVCLSEERFGDGETIGSGQTAAEVIYYAAQDYRINPQVLLVLLQKEQSLITDDYPNTRQYRSATGFGCPDTAACSAEYYGFKNQVRQAAKMFRTVLDGGWSNYPAGKTSYIQYNPNRDCGGSNVYIENRATSALYRYTPYQPNASAINAGYGTGDTCGAYGNRNFYLYFVDWFGSTQVRIIDQTINEPAAQNDLKFEYQTHVAEIGWQDAKSGGEASGTVGQSVQLEAFSLGLGQNDAKIVYRSHISGIGWEDWRRGGSIAGTTGQGRALEAIQIQLTDDLAEQYDIYYRVHASDIGWMGWAKNGAPAGTASESRRLEAIQITIIKKGTTINLPNSATSIAFRDTKGDATSYITVNYQAHIANIGWMDWVNNGALAGTTGQSRPLEAVEIKLSGDLAKQYSIRYRAHVSDIGWMNWVKDGQTAGTTDQNHRIEAIQIQLIKK